MSRPLLVVLCGPTAVGKTVVAVQLAVHFKTSVFSADSRQLYKEIPVGTAQPSAEELKQAPHFFIASHSIHQPLDAGSYARECRSKLEEEFRKHPVIIMAGGSGLYIDAVLNGFDDLPVQNEELRAELQSLFGAKGIAFLQEELKKLDPVYYETVDKENPSRLIRAIEVCRLSGKRYSDLRSGKKAELPFDVLKIGLELPREELYARIHRRVDQMLADGLEAEAKTVFPYRTLGPLNTVGYKEFFDYFEGKTDFKRAVELIAQHTRNYAKRQMTWWRKDISIHWFHPSATAQMITAIETAAH